MVYREAERLARQEDRAIIVVTNRIPVTRGQEGLEDDHPRDLERLDDHDRRDQVGQDLAEDEAGVAHPERPAGEDAVALADGQGLGPDDAGVEIAISW